MTALGLLSLAGILWALALVPGLSVVAVTTRTATLGPVHGVAVTAGIVLGDLLFIALALFGLTALAQLLGGVFVVIRVLAGLCLIGFGIHLLRHAGASPAATPVVARGSLGTSFLAGLLITLGDMKAILFYLSLLPVFVDLGRVTSLEALMILAVSVFAVGSAKLLYVVLAWRLRTWRVNPRLRTPLQRAAGGVMVGAGAWLVARP